MEGLTTEQFETVLRLCDLLGIEDFSTGVLLLKQTNWNLEKAIGFEQSSHAEKNRLDKGQIYTSEYEYMKNMGQEKYEDQLMNYQQKEIEDQALLIQYQYDYYQNQFNRMQDARKNQQLQNEGFEKKILNKKSYVKEGKTKINEQSLQQYRDCETSEFKKSNLIYQQNLEYLQMERQFQIKRYLSQARKQSIQAQQNQIQKIKQHFKHEPQLQAGKTIQFRFRLPISGNSLTRTFRIDQKVMKMFQFIHCFGRNQFQDKFAKFDLTQSFPMLSLEDNKQKLISQVFSESVRQNIIVKQL